MPSLLHEALLTLFRNRPALAPELLRDTLHVSLPEYTDVRIESENLTNIQPAEYRADMVVLLLRGEPVLGIVLEMQLRKDDHKRYSWPVYAVSLRARIRCPVYLFVITAEERVARWASEAISLGGDSWFIPRVLPLSGIPEITDEEQAREDPELAVLSALAHARDRDSNKAMRIAITARRASTALNEDRSSLYCDLIMNSLPKVARRALENMNIDDYEFQSPFARCYFRRGKKAGRKEGRIELLLEQLDTRFGALSEATVARVRAARAPELDGMTKRVLTANTLDEALGAR